MRNKWREIEGESKLPLSCSQNVFCTLVSETAPQTQTLRATVALQSVRCTACCTSLSDGLLLRTLTYSTLQSSPPPNGTAPNIHTLCQVCVPCEKWALCCLRPLNLKVPLSRLKPRHTELLHTTAGPDTFQSAAHFSPHFLYIIHTIKHIKFNACRCAVPCS